MSSSSSEFQTVGPAIENARRPYFVLSRQRGTMSWCRFAERRRSREAMSEAACNEMRSSMQILIAKPKKFQKVLNYHEFVFSTNDIFCPRGAYNTIGLDA